MKTAALWACLLLLGACSEQTALRIGTGPEEPAAQIAKALREHFAGRFRLSVTEYKDLEQLTAAVQKGEVEFAIIEQPQQHLPDLQLVTPLFRSVLHVMIRRSLYDCSEPVSLTDMVSRGKVYAGVAGTAGYQLLEALSSAGWLPMERINLLDNPFEEDPDVFIQFGGFLSRDAESRLPDFCLASLGDVAQLGRGAWAEGVSYRYPHLTPFVLPAGIYPSLTDEPVLSLAVTHLLVTNAEVSADVVYDAISLVKAHANEIGAIDPLVNATVHENFIDERLNLPLHPGTHRYLQRNAPTFLERYAELLAFVITALVAATSAAVAIVRIRRQTKKDRIDAYMNELMAVRAAYASGACSLSHLWQTVSALQATVTQLVVEERLMADTTFIAFLTLSNQILNEAREPYPPVAPSGA